MSSIDYRVVPYESFEYREAVKLRDEILRKPLGLSLTLSDLEAEAVDTFIVAQQDGRIIGCLVLSFLTKEDVRMRQVAVASDRQGQGIGAEMVRLSEKVACEKGSKRMILHAREQAVGFYRRMGYSTAGEPFDEVKVPHWLMIKNLPTTLLSQEISA